MAGCADAHCGCPADRTTSRHLAGSGFHSACWHQTPAALLQISSMHLATAWWQGRQLDLLDSMAHLEVTKTSGRLTSQSEKTSVSAAPMALSLPCCDMPSTSLQPPLVDSLQHGHDMPKQQQSWCLAGFAQARSAPV